MSLLDRSDGILETHVHWEEIQERMQVALGTDATFGPNKTVKNVGEGNGFLSRISLIHPDWQNGSEDLPKAFIAKICCPLTLLDFSKKANGMKMDMEVLAPFFSRLCYKVHNVEVNTYNILEKYGENKIRLPKIYYSQKFTEENPTKGYLIMEFFDDLVPCHITDCIDIEAIKKCLRSIAVLEAIGLKMTDEEKSWYSFRSLTTNFGELFGSDMLDVMEQGITDFCEGHEEIVAKFINASRVIASLEYMNYLDDMPEALGIKPVLCHGDLWSTNILWNKKDGKYDIKGHIDWQTAAFGSPAIDLCRLFCANLSGKDRREHWEDLLKTFYGYLTEEVDGEMPYTYEQLVENYKKFIPFGGFFVAPMVGPLFQYIKEHRPEAALSSKEIIMEKLVALLEDVVEAYEPPKKDVNSNTN